MPLFNFKKKLDKNGEWNSEAWEQPLDKLRPNSQIYIIMRMKHKVMISKDQRMLTKNRFSCAVHPLTDETVQPTWRGWNDVLLSILMDRLSHNGLTQGILPRQVIACYSYAVANSTIPQTRQIREKQVSLGPLFWRSRDEDCVWGWPSSWQSLKLVQTCKAVKKSVCMFISSVFSHSFYIPGFYHRVLV